MFKRHHLGCAALMCLTALPAHAQKTAAVEALQPDAREAKVNEAIHAMQTGKPAEAIALLDPVLAAFDKEHPASGPYVFCASDISGALVGLVSGAAAKKDAIALGNTWCYALWAKGYALVELGHLDDAIVPLSRAAQMMPDNAQFHTELGYVHQTLKHWNESNLAYTAAAAAAKKIKDPQDRNLALRRAWFGIGFNEIELGQYDDAEKHMRQALEAAPGDQKILNELEFIRAQKTKVKD